MGMKKWGYLVILLLVASNFNSYKSEKAVSGDVYNFLNSTGAEFLRMDTEAHSNFITDENEEEVAVNLFNNLGYKGEYDITNEDEMTQLKFRENDLEIIIKVRRLQVENLTYASTMLSHYSMGENINSSIRGTMERAFANYKAKPSFSTLISGKYNEKFTISQMKDRALSILKSLGASFVSGMDEGNLVSVSGFTKEIKERIKIDNQYMNLNIALRYSESSNCTYIWIGSPIIAVEY
jgi:hypothetical protein